jgi:hypothetical protein
LDPQEVPYQMEAGLNLPSLQLAILWKNQQFLIKTMSSKGKLRRIYLLLPSWLQNLDYFVNPHTTYASHSCAWSWKVQSSEASSNLEWEESLLNALWHLKILHLKHLWNEKPSLTWNNCCQTGEGLESMHPQSLTVPCGIYPVTFNWRVRDQWGDEVQNCITQDMHFKSIISS